MSITTITNTDAEASPFLWTYTEEPHRSRRQAIIKAHPEVLKLCGPDLWTKYIVTAVVLLQIVMAYLLRDTNPRSWLFLGTAYLIGATASQNLFLGIHEMSHNLAFKAGWLNRVFAVFANLPIVLPYSASFRPYHLTHHKSLGVDGLDTDIPTAIEAFFLDSIFGKAFFCTFQIFFYAVRPMCVYNLPLTKIQIFNLVVQLLFDYAVVHFMGYNALLYLILSACLAGSLHPCAGHFISEHYVFSNTDNHCNNQKKILYHGKNSPSCIPLPETYSYYGPLNILTYNVGYHNEHHDFPAIPWSRLPTLHRIAREFYADLPCHTSWAYVMWQFVMDDNVGLWCRVKRSEGGRKVGGTVATTTAAANTTNNNNAWKDDELDSNETNGCDKRK